MPAPRKFDSTDVVERAMLSFWRLGYDGCSISDLVAATGLQRQSLYNAFGSKEGLFVEVLALYHKRVEESLKPLEADTAGIEQLAAYFRSFLALQGKLRVGACLVVQTAYSPAMSSTPIRRAVHASAVRVRDVFAKLLRRTADRAKADTPFDCVARAADLYALLNGLSALAATGADRRLVDGNIDRAMKQLDVELQGHRQSDLPLGISSRRR